MQDISIKHSKFSFINSKDYSVSISFRRDGFSFCIWDKLTKEVKELCYKPISDNLSDYQYQQESIKFLSNPSFSTPYKDVSIIIVSNRVTIVPNSFNTTESVKDIFTFNHEIKTGDIIMSQELKCSEDVILYSLSNFIKETCSIKFGKNVRFYSQASPFIEAAFQHNINNTSIYISLESTFFDVLIIKNKTIKMYNTYTFKNVNDYMFYVMNIFEKFQLDQLNVPLYISGRISEDSSYLSATKMFIKDVNITPPLFKETIVEPFNTISHALFSQHFNLSLCE